MAAYLITGGAGFIGSHLAEELVRRGERVRVADSFITGKRENLAHVPGVELIEPAEWELCCGSAGIYNLVQPEPAAELGERKARNLLDTGAEAVVAGNPGCALQIAAHTERLGRRLPVLHPMELLARSIA